MATVDNNENQIPTIGMLLDIEHIAGVHESRMGPVITVLCIACAPWLFYVYYAAWNFIPLWLFIILNVLLDIEAALIFIGNQKVRVDKFKKQLYSDYSEPANLLNIKTIHPDGCVEYINGNIYYYVVCFNGTIEDEVIHSTQLKKMVTNLVGDFEYDTYLFNINDAPALRNYYEKISTFNKSEAASNFVQIIDHNLDLVENGSVVMCTVYAIRGRRSDWKVLSNQIDVAIGSKLSRCYKSIHKVTSEVEINEIINRDADTVVNIPELLRKKYANQDYGSSKVLAYDLPDDMVIIQGGSNAKPLVPEHSNQSFHKVWKG